MRVFLSLFACEKSPWFFVGWSFVDGAHLSPLLQLLCCCRSVVRFCVPGQDSIDAIVAGGADIDLIELRTLKPLDMETIGMSLRRTHKVTT